MAEGSPTVSPGPASTTPLPGSLAPPTPMDPSPDSAGRLLLRLALMVAGFAFVWLMEVRVETVRNEFASTFAWPAIPWLLFLGSGLLAGLAFGLALFLPARFGRYRWVRALVLGAVPLMVLTLGLVFLPNLGLLDDLPEPLIRAISRLVGFFGFFFQAVAAILVGVAVASGFAEPHRAGTPALPWPANH